MRFNRGRRSTNRIQPIPRLGPGCNPKIGGLGSLIRNVRCNKKTTMKTITTHFRFLWLLTITQCCLWHAVGADALVPAAIEKGFQLLKTGGAMPAFETWRDGGVLDDAARTTDERRIAFRDDFMGWEAKVRAIGADDPAPSGGSDPEPLRRHQWHATSGPPDARALARGQAVTR